MSDKLDNFYLKQEEPNNSCLLALRDVILSYDSGITATLKYGMPCFTYNGKHICYLWTDKKTLEPYILIVDGNKIEHPRLKAGDRKRMKIFPIDPNQDLPLNEIHNVLTAALAIHRNA
jgi:hypothetical protein